MKKFLVFFLLFSGQAFAADSSVATPDFLSFLKQIAEFILNNPAITAPLTVWVLALIPGPLRGVAQAVLGWLLEQAKGKMADHAVRAAYDWHRPDLSPVNPQENDLIPIRQEENERAFEMAVTEAVKLGIPDHEAQTRVRSAFRELKASGQVK
jgi:hypothetical protein